MSESGMTVEGTAQDAGQKPDIDAITRELRNCLQKSYTEWQEGWFSSVFMGSEQVLAVNGEETSEGVAEDEVVSGTVAPCEQTRTLKIAHFHENIRKTPIPQTPFKVEQREDGFFGGWKAVHTGTTDAQGIAEVPVTPGKEYRVVMAPDISRAEMDALYGTYDSFVEECCSLLERTWQQSGNAAWDQYLSMDSAAQYLAIYNSFNEGLVDGFAGILDDIRRIYQVIAGLLDYDFSDLPDDLAGHMETLKKTDDAYLKACLVANDEIFLFLVMYTVRQYFRLLTPTQVADVSGELIGQLLFDVVVGLLITGGVGLATKYGARVGSKAAARAVAKADSPQVDGLGSFLGDLAGTFQRTMDDIGTRHRPLQVSSANRLDTSSTNAGSDLKPQHHAYTQTLTDGDTVAGIQSGKQNNGAVSSQTDNHVPDRSEPPTNDQGQATRDNESTEKLEDPISTVTGEELLELTDARLPGPLPFEFKRVYRSASSDRCLDMGYGWRHSLNHSLVFGEDGIVWHDHEGKKTVLPLLEATPAGTNKEAGIMAWRAGDEYVACAGAKAPRYHFVREGSHGRLSRISDRYGNRLKVSYDLHGKLFRVTNTAGQALAFGWNEDRLVSVSFLKRVLTEEGDRWDKLRTERLYGYDDDADLTSAEDAEGGKEHYRYDNHMLVQRQLAGGYSFYLEWDQLAPAGRCIRQWGDSAQVDTRFEWDDENHSCTARYVDGSEEHWFYDGAAKLQEKIDPDGAKHLSEYDEKGRLVATTDPMGARTEYTYNRAGQLQQKVGPDGQPVLFTYQDGRIAEIHRNGQTWRFTYTDHGDLATETDPKGRVTRYHYNEQGLLKKVRLPDGRNHTWGWNDQGQLLEETTPTGAFHQYRYDEFGQLMARKDARGGITKYRYDGLGRVVEEMLPGKRSRRYEYNHYGKVTRFVDEKGRETRYEYGNNLHLLTRRINPDGSELRYHYDHHRFLLTAIENERGEEYRIDYYPNGLVREETAFDGHRTAYQYDLNGHLIEKAEYGTASDVVQTTAFERDEQGRLTKKVLPDGREVRYAYNPDGKLLAVDDGHWPLAFEYDQYGLLKAEHQGWASLHYRYDEFDRLSGMVLPDGQRVDYLRDATGLLSGIDLNGEELTRHRLSATGEEMERHQGDLVSAYEYDEEGRLTRHRVHQQSLRDIAAQRDYQYDPHGNLKSVNDSRKGLREYVYDPMDRLVGVHGDLHEQLIHDPAGNLLEQTSGTTSSNKANVRGNRLTMHGDSQYEYDDFGNLIEERRGKNHKLVTRYSYDCEHRLTSVTTPEGSTWHYEYDAFGRRIAKTNGLQRTEFLWQGDRLIAEESDDQYRSYLYEPDSFRPLALLEGQGPENAQVYYYHLDHLGTPQELTNKQGQLVWSVTYRAYGNVVKQQVAEIENPIRFQGQYHDPETGLHYNRHRYYNPNTGRFITPDPIGLAGGLNNYQYVPNPTGWVDPLGLVSELKNGPGSNAGQLALYDPAFAANQMRGYGISMYDENVYQFLSSLKEMTLGPPGGKAWLSPADQAFKATSKSQLALESGLAPSVVNAANGGGDIYATVVPMRGLDTSPPQPSDGGANIHFLEGAGHTAVRGEDFWILNQHITEVTVDGGGKMPKGSMIMKFVPGNGWALVRSFE
jgi:RHS repeat-associated protein